MFDDEDIEDYLEEENFSWQKLLKRLVNLSNNKEKYISKMKKAQECRASEMIAAMLKDIASK